MEDMHSAKALACASPREWPHASPHVSHRVPLSAWLRPLFFLVQAQMKTPNYLWDQEECISPNDGEKNLSKLLFVWATTEQNTMCRAVCAEKKGSQIQELAQRHSYKGSPILCTDAGPLKEHSSDTTLVATMGRMAVSTPTPNEGRDPQLSFLFSLSFCSWYSNVNIMTVQALAFILRCKEAHAK